MQSETYKYGAFQDILENHIGRRLINHKKGSVAYFRSNVRLSDNKRQRKSIKLENYYTVELYSLEQPNYIILNSLKQSGYYSKSQIYF